VIDLMVTILVAGLLLGVIVPAMNAANEAGRRTQCANNVRQVSLSLLNFSSVHNTFPNAGTFHDDPESHRGDPTKSSIYVSITNPSTLADGGACWLYSWVVDIMPYIDQADIDNPPPSWDRTLPYWSETARAPQLGPNAGLARSDAYVFRCPSDPTVVPG